MIEEKIHVRIFASFVAHCGAEQVQVLDTKPIKI